MNGYVVNNLLSRPEILASVGSYQAMVANDKDFLCSRVAYKLNLRGPAVGVQTACSTSLVAVEMAFESLSARRMRHGARRRRFHRAAAAARLSVYAGHDSVA